MKLKFKLQGPDPSLRVQIPRPKFKSRSHNPSLETKVLALGPEFQDWGANPGHET